MCEFLQAAPSAEAEEMLRERVTGLLLELEHAAMRQASELGADDGAPRLVGLNQDASPLVGVLK